MTLPKLLILVVEMPLKLKELSHPVKTFKKMVSLNGCDLIIVPISKNEIDIYLLETPNTLTKHDGHWRQIMFMQEKKYEYQGQKFSYFNLEQMNLEIMVNKLEKFFNLTIIECHT